MIDPFADLVDRYRRLSDEEFVRLERGSLSEPAQEVYDRERVRRAAPEYLAEVAEGERLAAAEASALAALPLGERYRKVNAHRNSLVTGLLVFLLQFVPILGSIGAIVWTTNRILAFEAVEIRVAMVAALILLPLLSLLFPLLFLASLIMSLVFLVLTVQRIGWRFVAGFWVPSTLVIGLLAAIAQR